MKRGSHNIFTRNRPIGDLPCQINDREYFDSRESGGEILAEDRKMRFNWGAVFALLFVLSLIYRLFFLQVEEGLANFEVAEGNRTRVIYSSAPRGLIVDANGKTIVDNKTSYQLVCTLSKKKELDLVPDEVFNLIGAKKDEVWEKIEKASIAGNVVIREKIEKEDALLLKKDLASYQGFEISPMYLRDYPFRNLSHVLGYIGKVTQDDVEEKPSLAINQIIGKTGIEEAYDEYLQGTPGAQKVEVDASGKLVRYLSQTEATIGNTVVSSIDLDLQNFVYDTLKKTTDEMNTNGVAIVMDPNNGSVKALVNIPDFDSNLFSSGMSSDEYSNLLNDPSKPLLNRAISGEYPSGSSIKPFIATVGLADGVITEDTSFETPAKIDLGQWSFPDWKHHEGLTDVKRAIAESNNIFFYALGGGWGPIKEGLGPERIKEGLEKFGFNKKIGIDILGEASGFIPTPEWKKKTTGENWYTGNTYNMSIGQGDLTVTPMQIANATVAIANGGTLYKPHFVNKITTSDGQVIKEFKPEDSIASKDIYVKEYIDIVREGMRQTITSGSARSTFVDSPLEVAAKTGTAQFGNEGKTHAWFTSFAPYNNPEIVVTVLIEGGGEGSRVSAPIASDIIKWWAENRHGK